MNEDFTIDDIMKWDNILFQLAAYEVSKGLMILPVSTDEALDLQNKICDKFNYFKRLIQSGEMPLASIQKTVLLRNGAIFDLDKKKNDMMDVDKLSQFLDEEEKKKDDLGAFNKGLDGLIKALLGGESSLGIKLHEPNIDKSKSSGTISDYPLDPLDALIPLDAPTDEKREKKDEKNTEKPTTKSEKTSKKKSQKSKAKTSKKNKKNKRDN